MPLHPPSPNADADAQATERHTRAGRHPVLIGAAVLALLLAAAQLLPRGPHDPEGRLAPQGNATTGALRNTAGPGRVTSEMRAEIDRVVAQGQRLQFSPRASTYDMAARPARCAEFDGQRYCLGLGWTTKSPQQATQTLAASARLTTDGRESTGDLGPAALTQRTARMSPQARAAQERAELTAAARSVAKVWLLRHNVQGVPLPAGFARKHPEAYVGVDSRGEAPETPEQETKTLADYPQKATVLKQRQVRPQQKYYWCGPSTMQMIAWGWESRKRPQSYWADQLGTTTSGTAITDMVNVVNEATGWDDAEYAGTYVALDISDFTYAQWYLLLAKHISDYRAPLVLHPVLEKQYFPYLDDDASGHFQVGRGFDTNPEGSKLIGYFEPWDQSRFDPTEPRIARTQWQSAYKSYRANQAHFQHNIGV